MKGLVDENDKIKGSDGKRYAGTENGKDKCIPVKEESPKFRFVIQKDRPQLARIWKGNENVVAIAELSGFDKENGTWWVSPINYRLTKESIPAKGWKNVLKVVEELYKQFSDSMASEVFSPPTKMADKGFDNLVNFLSKYNESAEPVNETSYEAELDDNEPRIVIGVYGAKSKEFRKKFANQKAQDRFFDHPDREGNFEIHYVQKANMAEGVIIGHDKDDPQVAVLGGAGSYKLSNLKKKALGEAKQLAQDIENGEYKNSAYNVKQLANTLNTIVAAEDEMEKLYFGEDFTGQFAAERAAETNPYGGMKDRQYRGALGEDIDEARPMTPGLKAAQKNLAGLASGEVQRRERERKSAEKAQRQASKDLDRMLNRKPAKKSKQDLETLWAKIESVIANSFPDGEPYDQLWPYMQKHGFTQDDVERASKMNGYNDLWDYWNTLTQDIENDAYADWLATGGKNVRTRGTFVETPTDNPTGASGEGGWRKYRPKVSEDLSQADVDAIERFADKLYKKLGIDITFTKHFLDQVNHERNGKPISGAELVRLFKKEYERWGKDVAQMGPDMEGTFKDLTTNINLPFVLRWDRDEEELDLVTKTVMRKKNFKSYGNDREFPVDEGEEQLDEKCWDGYKQVGMKKKGDRMVPNCVQKESAIMRGLRREGK